MNHPCIFDQMLLSNIYLMHGNTFNLFIISSYVNSFLLMSLKNEFTCTRYGQSSFISWPVETRNSTCIGFMVISTKTSFYLFCR